MPHVGYNLECDCPADFRIRDGKGNEVDAVHLDHYAHQCPDPPIPRILANALYEADSGQRYGQEGTVLSATLLTQCPLTVYYKERVDYITKVLAGRWKLRGSFGHWGLLKSLEGVPGWIVEKPMYLEVDTADGLVDLYGTPDAIYKPEGKLYDLKTQLEYAIKKKMGQTDEEMRENIFVRDNEVQLNVYSIMADTGFYNETHEAVDQPIEEMELQYCDGKMRFRRLEVRKAPRQQMWEWIKKRTTLFNRVLNGDLAPEHIPMREYDNWNPNKKSGVWYRVKQNLRKRAA